MYLIFLRGIANILVDVCLLVILFTGLLCFVGIIIDPIVLGKVSFDTEGIAIYMPFGREYTHSWDSIKEISTIGVTISQDDTHSYWVYCSTRPLTVEEQRNFMTKTRLNRTRTLPDLNNFVYFQADVEILEELISVVPSAYVDQLREDQVILGVLLHSNSRERRFNKR